MNEFEGDIIKSDKEFIRLLKEELDSPTFRRFFKSNIIHRKIDTLAGDDLT